VLNSRNNFKLCRLKTKYSSENEKLQHFGKNTAKTRHFGKITAFTAFDENHVFRDFRVSVIIYCPYVYPQHFFKKIKLENVVLKAKPESGLTSYQWANADRETGLPYDFKLKSSVNAEVTYVEVKATLSDHKACFEFSQRQLVFAGEHGANYHLYRVYCAGDPIRVRLVRVENLAKRLEERQLKLFMAL